MKSDSSSMPASQGLNKWEVVVYGFALFGTSQIMTWLCEMSLHRIVLLSASVISIGNVIYYGVAWKDLQKSFRLGLAILFLIIASIGFMLYQSILRADKLSQWDLPVELFGGFVLMLTIIFIYKHKTPSFWNWV